MVVFLIVDYYYFTLILHPKFYRFFLQPAVIFHFRRHFRRHSPTPTVIPSHSAALVAGSVRNLLFTLTALG
jgi:hypothetical protein